MKSEAVDKYISQFPVEIQVILEKIRKTIFDTAPQAEETINYQIPTFKFNKKNLVHFAGYKNFIGFYPTPSGIEKFKDLLSDYETSKGTIRFPLDKQIPYDLIAEIVKFRYEELR